MSEVAEVQEETTDAAGPGPEAAENPDLALPFDDVGRHGVDQPDHPDRHHRHPEKHDHRDHGPVTRPLGLDVDVADLVVEPVSLAGE